MDIPCLSSIINNFGKLWINTFPVTCWRGEGRQHDHSNNFFWLISLWLHAMHSSHGPSLRVNWGIVNAHCSPTQFWEKDTDLQITEQTLASFKWPTHRRWRKKDKRLELLVFLLAWFHFWRISFGFSQRYHTHFITFKSYH